MAKSDYEAIAGRARASVNDAVDHIADAAGSAARGARQLKEDSGKYAKEQFYRTADQASEKGREIYYKAGSAIEERSSQLDSYVRQNPLRSVGIAFVLGALFGVVTRR